MTNISEFYKINKVNLNFDEEFYSKRFPYTKNFYQPYCRINNIDEKHRLYFHWMHHSQPNFEYNSIENFYSTTTLSSDFDADFYLAMHPEAKDFYEPYCSQNGIEEKYRLYMHWFLMGPKHECFKNIKELNDYFFLFKNRDRCLTTGNSKVCVIVHAYFFDIWEEDLAPYIQKINILYDLYVSLPESSDFKDKSSKIKSLFPNAYVFSVPNKGADVGPFFNALNIISNLSKTYDYVLKLHTKKSTHLLPIYVKIKRTHFYKNLCENIDYCVDIMEKKSDIGMVGAPNTRMVLDEVEDKLNLDNFKRLLIKFNLKDKKIDFIAGTMFVCRFDLLKKYFSFVTIEDFEDGYKTDGTIAHSFERLFGNMVRSEDQKIFILGE